MDQTAPAPAAIRYQRLLPYWAVFQTDVRQTLRSWVYRVWVALTVLAAVGFIVYRVGVHREAGLVQSASLLTADLLRWMLLGSLALVVVLTVSAISAERTTLGDSVLSRGISRHQYFLAKLHARSLVVLATFALLAGAVLTASHFLLGEDLALGGAVAAVVVIASVLGAIASCGVTIGALANSTVVGITLFWLVLYGTGFLATLLPASYPSPEWLVKRLPLVLRGHVDVGSLTEVVVGSIAVALLASIVGLIGFSRRDV